MIPALSHTFVEIGHGIIYMVTLLLSLIQEGLLQLQAKVYARDIGKPLSQTCPWKNVVRLPDSLDMTIADCDVKPQTKQNLSSDVDQETRMFGSHDRSLKYRCVSSKYIQINI